MGHTVTLPQAKTPLHIRCWRRIHLATSYQVRLLHFKAALTSGDVWLGLENHGADVIRVREGGSASYTRTTMCDSGRAISRGTPKNRDRGRCQLRKRLAARPGDSYTSLYGNVPSD
jgi:hypothetical protein